MKKLFVLAIAGLFINRVCAQEHHHEAPDTTKPRAQEMPEMKAPEKQMQHHDMADMEQDDSSHHTMLMSHAYSLNLPMSRNGSGTSWLPDNSPMYMYFVGNAKSSWAIHGAMFFRYNNQDVFNKGSRGANKFDAPNWFMGMYNRRVGSRGWFNATAMISLDPLTVGQNGYPLLFQTGETYNGEPLVDRQHPHDLISGLSVAYTHMLDENTDITVYAGYPGEPALGPVAFMHRISSLNNPNAPLGHHWQDATHIVYGVATLGIRYKKIKLEGSIFNGREPDEDRYRFDKGRFDSYSYRVSYNPSQHWALQFSQGFLREPEVLEPGIDQVRTTASVIRSTSLRTMNWSQTLAWGMNDKTNHEHTEYAVLYETNLQFVRQALYVRYEFVKKSAEELAIQTTHGDDLFNIHELTLGYNHNISPAAPVDLLLGLQATLNFPGDRLKPIYGTLPVGLQVYLQLRPHKHQH